MRAGKEDEMTSNAQPYIVLITKHGPEFLGREWVLHMLKTIQDADIDGNVLRPEWVMADQSVTGIKLATDSSPNWFSNEHPGPYDKVASTTPTSPARGGEGSK